MVVMGHCRTMNTKTLKEGRKDDEASQKMRHPKTLLAEDSPYQQRLRDIQLILSDS